MKKDKLERLFNAAGNESPPQPGPDFVARVMRDLRKASAPIPASVWDQLNALFPRLAFAAAVLIVLCVTTDWVLTSLSGSDLASGVSRLSEEWLFATKGF